MNLELLKIGSIIELQKNYHYGISSTFLLTDNHITILDKYSLMAIKNGSWKNFNSIDFSDKWAVMFGYKNSQHIADFINKSTSSILKTNKNILNTAKVHEIQYAFETITGNKLKLIKKYKRLYSGVDGEKIK